ncbi:head maturation protease, ClpP-related [Methylobacterium gossipiicola]|uniref:ATP-dependent Clp protease proteolytic subunit n=1 Tax=Methylobacterium gossipiicola TaxID=582675 RepID=A0A1I2VWS9_9HYPH|nr:head maturation protease, ClpP-related [Methylobacterium gossipiicola]SFG92817.1 ATP-dependent protease ClpP, protease subunit [Methylobacterium gossipiicola]
MAARVDGNEIVLSGTVGDLYWDDSFSASDVILALAQVGRDEDVTIRLNSGGGIATEGAAIHAAIAAHRGRKTIVVEGIAASAASVIAMAGDEVVMSLGALMMVHDPSGFTFGTVDDHELQIKALTALATAMAGIYAGKTGKTVAAARADMQAEIWMTPDEAVAAGYADRTLARMADDEAAPEPTAFDYRLFEHPPERLVALADQRAWTQRVRPTTAAVPPRPKDKPMATAPAGSEPVIPPNPSAPPTATVEGAKPAATAAKPAATAATMARADAAEIVTLCVAGGVPAMAASLIAEGVSVPEAKDRIGAAGEVRNLVALARRKDPTLPEGLDAIMLAEGKTVEQARAALFDKLVASEAQTSISSHPPAALGNAGASASATSMQRELKRAGLTKGA